MPDTYNPPVARAGIYRIVHRESGKSYVGSTTDFQRRWSDHRSSVNHGTHRNTYLSHAVHKYGWDAFDFVIEEHTTADRAYLLDREQVYLDAAALDKGAFYNVCWIAGAGPGYSGNEHYTVLTPEKIPRGESCGSSILTDDQVVAIRRLYSERNMTLYEIAERFSVTRSAIGTAVHGNTWAHIAGALPILRHGNQRLSESDVVEIRCMYASGGNTFQSIGDVFGITESSAGTIINGRSWKYVGGPIRPKPTKRRLTSEQVASLRALYEGGSHTFQTLATLFGVSIMTAHRYVRMTSSRNARHRAPV